MIRNSAMATEKGPIPFAKPLIGNRERQAVADVLSGPILVHGPRIGAFEEQFALFTDAPHAVAVSSCTAGMHLIWFTLGLGPGDEVLVPAQTHTATAHAVELTGARAVFVDSELDTGNIDLDALESAITPRTRAIAVVHFLGMPVDMDRVMQIAQKNNLFVLEDCALAVGTRFKGVHAGLWGDAGVFSFYPVKHITTAEGGMVITRDENLAKEMKLRRAFGVDRDHGERRAPGVYDVVALGYNYRMNELQAAIGIAQLEKVNDFLDRRRDNEHRLRQAIGNVENARFFESSHGPFKSSHYCCSLILEGRLSDERDAVASRIAELGVGTSIYYPQPVPRMTYYQNKYGWADGDYPAASAISDASIALPVGPHLRAEDVERVAASVEQALLDV